MPRGVYPRQSVHSRFWAKVNKTETCWLWTGGATRSNKAKYPSFCDQNRRTRLAHRFAYELLVGPIPDGLTLDHVAARGCTSTLCVNPAHLEPVTMLENLRRGNGVGAANARRTHCKRGHLLSPDNMIVAPSMPPTWRGRCRQCAQYRHAAAKAARKASKDLA